MFFLGFFSITDLFERQTFLRYRPLTPTGSSPNSGEQFLGTARSSVPLTQGSSFWVLRVRRFP